ncbi:anti-sigma factor [Halomicronema sp. CCY15110]|uniref:anti-sigma factor n=1 Tax=Halomicronema sp. CCY15110 TaxID=2767773 RepID=UPI00194DD700|nr:anti-sigma factor [Halomicronema sp. CCY15110]
MNSNSLPDNWRSHLAGYVLNDLTEAETAQVREWLALYPEVAIELQALEASWQSLPESLPPQSPPPPLRDRVLTAVQSPPSNLASPPASPTPIPRRRRPWGWAGLGLGWAATAVALISVVAENQRLKQELIQSEAVVASFRQPNNRFYTLAGTAAQPQASGRLVVDPESETALIFTESLPPLMADQAYRLWAIADQAPLFCGQFNPSAEQSSSQWPLPDAACGAPGVQMLITAESVDAPPLPEGPLVLQSQS